MIKNNTVYLVEAFVEHEFSEVIGVFDTEKKAIDFRDEHKSLDIHHRYDGYEIHKKEVK